MTKLLFEPSKIEVVAKVGDRIVDITDEHPEACVPYSCRSANCGTCRVEVQQGLEAFAEADDDELGILDVFGSQPKVRLACQLKIAHEVDRIVLKVIDP